MDVRTKMLVFPGFRGPDRSFWPRTSAGISEKLPCRSAEVKFFSVFLCQRCREIWREIWVKFSVLLFPRFGCATENFTKISRQKRCEKRKNLSRRVICNPLMQCRAHADVDVMAQGSQCQRISVYCVYVHVCLACSRTLTSLRTRPPF